MPDLLDHMLSTSGRSCDSANLPLTTCAVERADFFFLHDISTITEASELVFRREGLLPFMNRQGGSYGIGD